MGNVTNTQEDLKTVELFVILLYSACFTMSDKKNTSKGQEYCMCVCVCVLPEAMAELEIPLKYLREHLAALRAVSMLHLNISTHTQRHLFQYSM